MGQRFESLDVKATDRFGLCPTCGAKESKIIWGWHGVYYDMVCPNEHDWTYEFPKQEVKS